MAGSWFFFGGGGICIEVAAFIEIGARFDYASPLTFSIPRFCAVK